MNKFLLGSLPIHIVIILSCLGHVHNDNDGESQLFQRCPAKSNFTSHSQFQTNLDRLLSSLVTNGTPDGLFNATIGSDPDTVYGLVSCRGDATAKECRECLNARTVEAARICPNGMVASIRYDTCLLHYSNRNFFSQVDNISTPYVRLAYVDAEDTAVYERRLGDLISNLSRAAASTQTRYASGSTDFNDFYDIYGIAQCTSDLSPASCLSCLQAMSTSRQRCCSGVRGGRFSSTTCIIRHELYQFSFKVSPASPPPPPALVDGYPTEANGNGGSRSTNMVAIIVPTIAGVFSFAICVYLIVWRKWKGKNNTKSNSDIIYERDDIRNEESLQFELNTIKSATNDFSDANRLGEGGFGTVYRGEFLDGHKIAVKRLSQSSGQGSQEFKNEVVLLHKLQHRNLVRLLGFCLAGEEKLLIYEYVPNRSLDKYIFDSTKKVELDWERRYKIIEGIARGLLYLHEDSRLRIIHRDLKAGNILLDEGMNAKIADFGMAKLFGVDQTQGNTGRIVGTLGYMAPEYAVHGMFSVKSDVFSFGVLLLEIISGQKAYNFSLSSFSTDLLSYAWKLWREGDALKLMDPILMDNYTENEVMRCIHIGLLCVQNALEDRPAMSAVVLMLNTYTVTLAPPSVPAFLSPTRTGDTDPSRDINFYNSAASSELYPR